MPTQIIMQMSEVVDRYTIAKLKFERLPAGEREDFEAQMRHFAEGIDFEIPGLLSLLDDLYEINGLLWDTESVIRRAEQTDLDPAEVIRAALRVRELNRQRCAIKNQLVDLTGEGWRDAKANYANGAIAR